MQILLAEDHTIVRSGLIRIVSDAFPRATIGEVGNCEELVKKVKEADWSVLILDIALGDKNSLELLPLLKELRPDMQIIVLSMYGERQFVIRALRAGVSGYLTKDRAPEELIQAIGSVLQGNRYIGEALASKIADYVALGNSDSVALHEGLSAREYEVLLLLASGLSVSEIAKQLSLSVKTISTYRSRILDKMGMQTNAQLMRYALDHGLVK